MTHVEPDDLSVAGIEPAELRLRVEDVVDRCAPELPIKYMLFTCYAFVGLVVPAFVISLFLGIAGGPWSRLLWFVAAIVGGLCAGTVVAVRRCVAQLRQEFLERADIRREE